MRLSTVSPKNSTGHSTVSSLYIRRFHGKYAFICIHLFCNRCDLQQLYLKSSRPYTDFPYFFLFFLTCSSRYGKIIFVKVAECKIWTRVSFPILLWINGKMNMRWCWNRQTGTFEGRVRERVGSSPICRTISKTESIQIVSCKRGFGCFFCFHDVQSGRFFGC